MSKRDSKTNGKEWIFDVYYQNSRGKYRWYRHSRRMTYEAAFTQMTYPDRYDLSIVRIRNIRTREIIPGALFA